MIAAAPVWSVVRDPRNWLASCIYATRKHDGHRKEAFWPTRFRMELYIQIAMHEKSIVFDLWFKSFVYRHFLAQAMGVPFTDAGLDEMPPFGGGSSFTQMVYETSAQKMAVVDRYRCLQGDPQYEAWIGYPGLLESYAHALRRTPHHEMDRPQRA